MNNGKYYKIDDNKKYILVGHSHSACAFNDSLISDFINLSAPMEGYFYMYYKLKKIIESNRKIEGIFVEFTNNQINSWADNRIWGKHLPYLLPKYWSIIDLNGIILLFSKNPIQLLKSIDVSIRKNLSFLSQTENSLISYNKWGGFVPTFNFYNKEKLDSIVNSIQIDEAYINNESISNLNLFYLDKIINLCKENKVKVYLVRSPLHNRSKQTNEKSFIQILEYNYSDIPFLDFKNFPLTNENFADLGHINVEGSKIFSTFFNNLMINGLLSKKNINEYINSETNKYFKLN